MNPAPFIPPAPAVPLPDVVLETLPNRRHLRTVTAEWCDGKTRIGVELGVGFDGAGRVVEVFADGHKQGSTMEALLDDACILVSFLLQSGWDIAGIAAKLRRESEESISPAPSIIGHIAQLAEACQAALATEIAAAAEGAQQGEGAAP